MYPLRHITPYESLSARAISFSDAHPRMPKLTIGPRWSTLAGPTSSTLVPRQGGPEKTVGQHTCIQ